MPEVCRFLKRKETGQARRCRLSAAPMGSVVVQNGVRLFDGVLPDASDILLLFVVVAPENREAVCVEPLFEGLAGPEYGEAMSNDGHDRKYYSRFDHS